MGKKKGKQADQGANGAPVGRPYFLSLSVENVRCFGEKQTLRLHDEQGRPARWTILLGDNGTGKTTLLEALARLSCLGASILDFARLSEMPVTLEAEIAFQELPPFTSTPLRTAVASVRWQREEGTHSASPPWQGWEPPRPVCFGYAAGRRLTPALSSYVADYIRGYLFGLPNPEGSTLPIGRVAGSSWFDDAVPLRNAEEWLLQVDYLSRVPSLVQERQKQRLDQVKQLLLHVLPDLGDLRISVPSAGDSRPRLEFHTPYGWVHLRALGFGYQTLIAWLVDLASRLVERYPDSPDPLAESAVVLVDEIDLHLHPQWQRKLISHLTERFPNTQFVVTTNSPLVVQSAPDANIVLLRREGDHVVIDNDVHSVRGWRIDQIYTSELFGLPTARPPEVEALLERRRKLLEKPNLSEQDKQEIAELEEKIGDLPAGETAEHIETHRAIRESLEVLKQSLRTRK